MITSVNMETWMNPQVYRGALLGVLAAGSAVTDLYCGKVLNVVTVPALCLGILLSILQAGAVGILELLCAAGFTVLVLFPFYRAGGLGAGDIKLMAAVSVFMPAESFLCCFAASFALGAAAGILQLILSKGKRHMVHFAVPIAVSVLLHLAGMY
ncbi:MAG: A24 family peptidase [Eubacteriales bacterium]|nr:A24 family peptidase [Eubacteriales bacterium]